MEKLNIVMIETPDGCYIAREEKVRDKYCDSVLGRLFFDGACPKPTWNEYWFMLDKAPEKIEKKVSHPNINYQYELKDKTMKSEKIPLVLEREEVCSLSEEGGWYWNEEYEQLSSLYGLASDKVPDTLEEVEFEIVAEFKCDKIERYKQFSYPATPHFRETEKPVTDKSVKHQIADTIFFPDLMLHTRPSKFTSAQVYKIVREHVKQNINPVYAEITSDYDFCFTVVKKIKLVESETYTVDVNIFHKRRKPKYETRYRLDRKVVEFAMTYSPYNYKGYKPIPAMVADTADALKKKMDGFLKDLMERINRPYRDCSECGGTGVVYDDQKKD